MPPSNQFPSDQTPGDTARSLPGIDPRKLNTQQLAPGNFASGGITIQQYLPYLIISNNTGGEPVFTLTARTAGGNPAITQSITLFPYSSMSIPTAPYISVVPNATSSSYAYTYSDLPLVAGPTGVYGNGSGGAVPVQAVDNNGDFFQPYQGGAAAPCSGVWHFMATISVASTALTVNTVSTLPIGTIASIASTSTLQVYEYAVVEGVTYTIAGGSVATSSGWIGGA